MLQIFLLILESQIPSTFIFYKITYVNEGKQWHMLLVPMY